MMHTTSLSSSTRYITRKAPVLTRRYPRSFPFRCTTFGGLGFSAKMDKTLSELAQLYIDCLEQNQSEELSDICFTTCLGREHIARIPVSSRRRIVAITFDSTRENLPPFKGVLQRRFQRTETFCGPVSITEYEPEHTK